MNTRLTYMTLAAAALSTACANSQINREIDAVRTAVPLEAAPTALPAVPQTYGSATQVERQAKMLNRSDLVRMSDQPWVGGLRTVARTEDRLPAIFNESFAFSFADPSTLAVVAARISQMTGVPVRIRDDVYPSGMKTGAPDAARPAFPTPVAGHPLQPSNPVQQPPSIANVTPTLYGAASNSVSRISMVYNGRLRDFLEHLTSTLSLAWEYQNGAVVISRMVTSSYDMTAFPGTQTFQMASGGSSSTNANEGGSTQAAQNRINVGLQGRLDVRNSILKTVQEILASEGDAKAAWAEGSGRMVITASRDAHAKVRSFLDQENKALRRMVNVTFDVYSVRNSDKDQKGVDWNSVFQSLSTKYGVSFKSPTSLTDATAGQVAVNLLSNQSTSTTNALLTLLSQYGESTQHRPISITTLNGQFDTKSRLSTDGYLKETTPGTSSTTGGAGAPGLKTDTITTGDQFAVLPYVQNDNTVMVKYSISLSNLLGFFDVTTGAGDTFQKVQTPRIDAINASSTVLLSPGETAVITGLSRIVASRDENRLTRELPIAAGGSIRSEVAREHFMVLMRATPL